MTPRRPSLLVVDDEPAMQMLLQAFADKEGFDVVAAGDGSQTLEWLRPGLADVAIVDLRMPQVDGLEVLAAIRATDPGCQVILMTGDPSVETAVQAVKAGALDYLSKPFDSARLRALLAGVREELDRRQAVLASETALARRLEFCGMIARSALMQELFGTIRRVAAHARTVLVSGETGSGKELVAAALHRLGPRAAHPPITVNCSSRSSRARCSATFAAPLPARRPTKPGCSRRHTAALSCWTKWANWRSRCRPSYCGRWRQAKCFASAGRALPEWMCG
jgi:DNA-binding NtrC family response regulator